MVREITFLKSATLSIISERRAFPPYGMAGGGPGKPGENLLKKASGEVVRLPHRVTLHLETNDAVMIQTPGGGGYGE